MNLERILSLNGNLYTVFADPIGQGTVKDVFITRDRQKVIALYRNDDRNDEGFKSLKERLELITTEYRRRIFDSPQAEYWMSVFCWPEEVVMHKGRIGLVAPVIPSNFYFEHGSVDDDFLGIKGREKEGKWFCSPQNRLGYLDSRERGTFVTYFRGMIQLCRAVRRLHAVGLSHSDLSYRNVLFDPVLGSCYLIDLDGLVVPGLLPPAVAGTPDFIAPEVMATMKLPFNHPLRAHPGRLADLHALAVLLYQFLYLRHPLRGKKVHSEDPLEDESLTMGEKALFIEDGMDTSNRLEISDLRIQNLPWHDTTQLPVESAGPYLSSLFRKAFESGLHNASSRPSAGDWEQALVKSVDLFIPCSGRNCPTGWYFLGDNSKLCPYCGNPGPASYVTLKEVSANNDPRMTTGNAFIVAFDGKNLYPWNFDRTLFPDEGLANEKRLPVADIQLVDGEWNLILRRQAQLVDIRTGIGLMPGEMMPLRDGQKIKTGTGEGARVFDVTLVAF